MKCPTLISECVSVEKLQFAAQKFIAGVIIGSVVLLLAGCAINESRRRSAEVIAQSTPEQQEMMKRGKIAVGFTKEMVRTALGGPNLVQENPDMPSSEIWSYWSNAGLWRDTTRVIFRNGTVAAMEIDSKRSQ